MLLLEKYIHTYLTDENLVTIKVGTKAEKKIAAAVIKRLIPSNVVVNIPDQRDPVLRQAYLLKVIDNV